MSYSSTGSAVLAVGRGGKSVPCMDFCTGTQSDEVWAFLHILWISRIIGSSVQCLHNKTGSNICYQCHRDSPCPNFTFHVGQSVLLCIGFVVDCIALLSLVFQGCWPYLSITHTHKHTHNREGERERKKATCLSKIDTATRGRDDGNQSTTI